MIKLYVLSVLMCLFYYGDCVDIPKYITRCKANDPNLNACAKKYGIQAIPYLVKGDKALKIPVLNPLKLSAVSLQASETLKISLKDITLSGLENIVLEDINMDLKNNHVAVVASCPHLNLIGTYEVKGRILALPVEGNGPANLTFDGSTFNYDMNFELIKKKDGKQYISNIKPSVKYDIKKSYFQFDNLFNGDKRLGDEVNKFVNENVDEVTKDISPAVSETIGIIITNILNSIFSKIPYDEIFI